MYFPLTNESLTANGLKKVKLIM